MKVERAQELQERMTLEAVAMLELLGEVMDTTTWEQTISCIGKAWGIPDEDTEKRLDAIHTTHRFIESKSNERVYPEDALPMNASGMETLENVWDLFETAIQLDDINERTTVFNIASELAECQSLTEWIEKTPAEKELDELVTAP